MTYYRKYIKTYWKPFSVAIFFLSLEAFFDLLQPTMMSIIIDRGVANQDLNFVLKMGGLMLFITLLGAISASTRSILASIVSQNFGTELRSDLYKKIHRLSCASIDKLHRASLITRMTNDITQVQNFVNGTMRIFVKAPLLIIGSIIMAVRLNVQLSIIFMVLIPMVTCMIILNMRMTFPIFMKVQKMLDQVNSAMREYLSGVRVVKAFNRFDYEMDKFQSENDSLTDISIRALRFTSLMNPAITFMINIGMIAVLWIGGNFVDSGDMAVGQVIAFTTYMTQILTSLMMVSRVFNMFVRAKASAERIIEVLDEEDSPETKEGTLEMSNVKGYISFDHVYFSYENKGDKYILKNIDFSCLSGEHVGIIGSTGSGKSSLVNLIPRFYDVTDGTITIDGMNIQDISPSLLREHIAIVPQKATLFTGTIMENIRWGNEHATLEEVKEVAKVAQIDSFISGLPDGYDTLIGQKGVNLSGGQRQRLSIARALIRKPTILILDDSTSALDAHTEANMKVALREYASDMTCITIAQKITSVADAAKILVLDQGEIVAIGTHDELLATSSVYQEIFQSQMGKGVQRHVQ